MTIMRFNCHGTGHNRCSALCVHMTDDQTRYPGTAPARSRLALTTHEISLAVDYPLTLRHRHGTLTEVLYNASVYRDAGGKVLGVFAAARDVTNQNQAHREIAQ
jgi:hypothetical protein